MVDKIKILTPLTILLIVISNSQPLLPNFRIEIYQDSIYVGEPIVIRYWLVNRNNAPVKVWDKTCVSLITYGYADFYLISENGDTSRYSIGICNNSRSMPSLEIPARDSSYWYLMLSWYNFWYNSPRSKNYKFLPGQYELISIYGLIAKDKMADSFVFPNLKSNEINFVATEIPDSERSIYDEWIPLTREYFWYGERFKDRWVRQDYNELCKRVAESKSRFARYAHYIYCKTTGDKKEMQKFLERYPAGPLSELIEFMFNPAEACKKYPLNAWAK
ncbi:MAG: hypothetical protein ACUVQP_09100 [Bacteroidales bacterium]